jgi:2-(1,2-epoxy-1,2-dihydrophenyl)acetyl-CoA isomerase
MELTVFEYSLNDNIAHIRINQPELGNPINTPFCREFNELSIECGENPEVKAVYIDAAGPNFSLGGDLKEFTQDPSQMGRKFKRLTSDLHMAVARFARNDAPMIVAAHNLVVGGAVALVAAADFVYATPKTQFYAAFSGVALCGDTGISHFLPRRVGSRRATEFMLLNEMWSAEKATDLGLINGVVEDDELKAHCLSIASRLAKGPTEVYGRMRRMLLTSFNETLEAQLETEARGMVDCANSPAAAQAMEKLLKKSR